MNSTIRKFLVGTAALTLPFGVVACGSDGDDDAEMNDTSDMTSDDMTTTTGGDDMTTTTGGDDMGATGGEPFGPACEAVPDTGAGSFEGMAAEPVATAASANEELTTLVSAVQAAELVDTLNSAEDITVFAPANAAFDALDPATLDAAMKDPKGLLTDVLQNHVVSGRLSPEDVAGEHETLGGGMITVEGSGEEFTVGEATVVCGNVQTANATVYIIDGVLLPE